MVVGHHQVGHRATCEFDDIFGNLSCLGKRCAAIDQQSPMVAVHQPDRDVEERQPTAVYTRGKCFPEEVHHRKDSPWPTVVVGTYVALCS